MVCIVSLIGSQNDAQVHSVLYGSNENHSNIFSLFLFSSASHLASNALSIVVSHQKVVGSSCREKIHLILSRVVFLYGLSISIHSSSGFRTAVLLFLLTNVLFP